MKNLVCPLYDISLQNIKIIFGNTPYIDIAKFYKKNELTSENDSFIFINEIDNDVIRNAFILIETLRAYDLCPYSVIRELLETNLRDKLEGLLKIVFIDDKNVEEFINIISTMLGLKIINVLDLKIAKSDKIIKEAQFTAEHPSSWWYLGLIEQQLEGVRGSDWSTYLSLEKYIKEFWDKVEEIKNKKEKKGNKDGIPFNTLLRLKSEQTVGYKTDPTKTLQGLLSSDRVW